MQHTKEWSVHMTSTLGLNQASLLYAAVRELQSTVSSSAQLQRMVSTDQEVFVDDECQLCSGCHHTHLKKS
jgi:hypothetical protein